MNIVQVEKESRALKVIWQDGSTNTLPFIWLRDNDPHELHPQTHERTFDLTSVSLDIQPESHSFDENGLEINWPDKESSSKYSNQWLQEHQPGIRRPDAARISKKSWPSENLTELPRFDAQACHSSPAALQETLISLKTTGIVLIENLADELSAGEEFGDLLGFKRESNYGVMFEVKSKPDPNNLAYTSLALPLHTDLANQEFVPGNQFLHCYRITPPVVVRSLPMQWRLSTILKSIIPNTMSSYAKLKSLGFLSTMKMIFASIDRSLISIVMANL